MCEILRSNFEEKLPDILKSIDNCAYIAIDTELTGVAFENESLFDSAEERYKILRASATKYIICQMGVSMFIPVLGENRYEVECYNVYTCPMSDGALNTSISLQEGSYTFLCKYNFDFNKFIYEGVPYLNKEQQSDVLDAYTNLKLELNFEHGDESLDETFASVAKWLARAKEGDVLDIPNFKSFSPYIVYYHLWQRFSDLWTPEIVDGKLRITKIARKKGNEVGRPDMIYGQKLVELQSGFSRVFDHMVRSKKPLIGHNMFLDLVMMFNQFHKPLPETLNSFKKELHQLFPVIYDTKHIVFQLRNNTEKSDLFEGTILHELYRTFSSPKGKLAVLYSPLIEFQKKSDNRYLTEDLIHEAGFDSYMTGYVFLRMAHYNSMWNKKKGARPLLPVEHLQSLAVHVNKINLIRAQINFINLTGRDPAKDRPNLLILQMRKSKDPLNMAEVTNLLAKYGNFDLRLRNPCQAVLAVGSHHCAREIMKGFRMDAKYHVSPYNAALSMKPLVSMAVLIAGGLGLWFAFKAVNR